LLYRVSRVTRPRRPSPQTAAVLQALAGDPERWRYGYDLCAEIGMQAGSMYPILMRLADRGLLETGWETERPGRPPRHLYRLTGAGREYAGSTAPAAPPRSRPTRAASAGIAAPRRPRPGLGGA
jgi:PadR family transcriptional regulator